MPHCGSARGRVGAWEVRIASFNHLVGAGEEGLRHCEAKGPRRFEVNRQLNFRCLMHGQVSRSATLEDLTDVVTDLAVRVVKPSAVTSGSWTASVTLAV